MLSTFVAHVLLLALNPVSAQPPALSCDDLTSHALDVASDAFDTSVPLQQCDGLADSHASGYAGLEQQLRREAGLIGCEEVGIKVGQGADPHANGVLRQDIIDRVELEVCPLLPAP